jgi:hypothetical protein
MNALPGDNWVSWVASSNAWRWSWLLTRHLAVPRDTSLYFLYSLYSTQFMHFNYMIFISFWNGTIDSLCTAFNRLPPAIINMNFLQFFTSIIKNEFSIRDLMMTADYSLASSIISGCLKKKIVGTWLQFMMIAQVYNIIWSLIYNLFFYSLSLCFTTRCIWWGLNQRSFVFGSSMHVSGDWIELWRATAACHDSTPPYYRNREG